MYMFMECVQPKSATVPTLHVEAPAAAAAVRSRRSHETAYIGAGTLALPDQFSREYETFP